MGQAANTMARLTRAQWKDWIKRFRPLENLLMRQTTYMNPNILPQALDRAQHSTEQYYNTAIRDQRMGVQDLGVRQTDDAKDVFNRSSDLSKTAILVDAANEIRERIMERDRAIAFGGSAGDRKLMIGQYGEGQ